MEATLQSKINPLPGYFLAVIDESQMDNVKFAGDDKFDLPQKGELVKLNSSDKDTLLSPNSKLTMSDLLNRKVMWAKYAESDCLLFDNDLNCNVVLIAIEKLRGYE